MATYWTGGPVLTVAEQADQARHDLRHPGKVCRACPVEIAHQRAIEHRQARLTQRQNRGEWCIAAFLLAVVLGCWLIGSWLIH